MGPWRWRSARIPRFWLHPHSSPEARSKFFYVCLPPCHAHSIPHTWLRNAFLFVASSSLRAPAQLQVVIRTAEPLRHTLHCVALICTNDVRLRVGGFFPCGSDAASRAAPVCRSSVAQTVYAHVTSGLFSYHGSQTRRSTLSCDKQETRARRRIASSRQPTNGGSAAGGHFCGERRRTLSVAACVSRDFGRRRPLGFGDTDSAWADTAGMRACVAQH
eukprot:1533721-Prymnesium_polylepis.1